MTFSCKGKEGGGGRGEGGRGGGGRGGGRGGEEEEKMLSSLFCCF